MVIIKSGLLPVSQKKVDRYVYMIKNKTYHNALIYLHSTISSKFKPIIYKLLLSLSAAAGSKDFIVIGWTGRGRYYRKMKFAGRYQKIIQKPHARIYLEATNVK